MSLSFDDLGRMVKLQNGITGKVVAVSGTDSTCIIRFPNRISGWISMGSILDFAHNES